MESIAGISSMRKFYFRNFQALFPFSRSVRPLTCCEEDNLFKLLESQRKTEQFADTYLFFFRRERFGPCGKYLAYVLTIYMGFFPLCGIGKANYPVFKGVPV
jgi:hypothetical protein